MFKVGEIVKYKKEWCSEDELKYRHKILEVRLNPVTNEMSRYLVETINTSLSLNPTEVVDGFMIEKAED